MAQGSIWAAIDPESSWRTVPSGYTDTSETPGAGTVDVARVTSPLSPKGDHFGFAIVLAGTAAVLYYIFEKKPSGARISANVGPLEAEVGGGLGKE
jgi:hypothetical protein